MNVYIRTNYNSKIGLGHLVRTTRLAIEMRKIGLLCFFFIDNFYSGKFLEFRKTAMYNNRNKFTNEINDAKLFCKLTGKIKPGIVLVDDYRLSIKWEKYVSKFHKKIITFDDIEDKQHYADTIINYNPRHYPIVKYNYNNNKKKNCDYLINLKYNILSRDKIIKSHNLDQKKFYITFYIGGGSDQKVIYKLLLELIKKIGKKFNKIKFLVVIGPLSINKHLIIKLAKRYDFIEFVDNSTNLYHVIKKSKIFIASSGTAVFESAYLKTPTILFKMSKNQDTDIFSLEKIGHYFFLDLKHLSLIKKFSKLIFLLINNYTRFKKLINNPEIKIDNKGSARLVNQIFLKKKENKRKVVEKLISYAKDKFSIRAVNDSDINHYIFSRNMDINRRHSSNTKKISILDHYVWWFESNRRSYVLLKNGKKVLYFYEQKLFSFNKKDHLLSGWFACSRDCSLKEIFYALNWQRNHSKKNIKWVSFIKKNNYLSIKMSKYIGWKTITKKSNIKEILKKKFNIKLNNFIFYQR